MEGALNLAHAETGLVTTVFFFVYGVGQFVHGAFCKRYPKKYTVTGSLLISALINILVFMNVPFSAMKYLWAVNAMVQSMFWPSLMCTIGEHLDEEHLQKSVIPMSIPAATGTFAVYGLSALCAVWGGYRYAFLISAVLMTGVGVWWFLSYDKMTSAWTAIPEQESKTKLADAASEKLNRKGVDAALLLGIAGLAVFSVCNNLIKDGLTTWIPSFLKETFGLADSLSIALSVVLPVFGLLGTVLVVRLCRKTSNFLLLTGGLFLCAAVLIFILIRLCSTALWGIVLAIFAVTSLLMYGINNVTTCLGPLKMRSKINSGTLAGILNGFAYVGSMISSYCLGTIADKRGWIDVIRFLLLVCLIPVVIAMVDYGCGAYKNKLRSR
ncbi:MAG: MFS transporter [Clostridia bacterium]|nr:MFS transporter [Clostridia bacterium]